MKTLVLCSFSNEILQKMSSFLDITVKAPPEGRDFTLAEVISLLSEEKYEILVIDATPLPKEAIKSSGSLKMIVCTRGNPVNVDAAYCAGQGILLTNTPGRNANAVAEFVIGMMINLLRKIPQAIERLSKGELLVEGNVEDHILKGREIEDVIWRSTALQVIPYDEFMGSEVSQKKLGLIGLGAVGRLVAEKAAALGMQVMAHDPYVTGAVPAGLKLTDLDTLAESADIVSLHAKDTPETFGMIGDSFFRKMKKGGYLVNSARGRLVDRSALLAALDSGRLSGAALDVFDYEPLCKDDPLAHHPLIICTPHIGGASRDVVAQHSLKAFESIRAYVEGRKDIPFLFSIL
jgi:D-3-phosphoglycerate dehydrogenase